MLALRSNRLIRLKIPSIYDEGSIHLPIRADEKRFGWQNRPQAS
jgi:hypothetical protein